MLLPFSISIPQWDQVKTNGSIPHMGNQPIRNNSPHAQNIARMHAEGNKATYTTASKQVLQDDIPQHDKLQSPKPSLRQGGNLNLF